MVSKTINNYSDTVKQTAQKRRINTKNEYSEIYRLLGLDKFINSSIIDDVTILRLALTYIQSKHFIEKFKINFKFDESLKSILY